MANLGGFFAKDNLFYLFRRVRVETSSPLKGPVTYSFQITAKIICRSYGFFNVRKRKVPLKHNLDYTKDYWMS